MFDPLIIAAALLCGLIATSAGLPALIGYLAAGFLLHELGASGSALLVELSDMGVTLLLFTIGLKLDVGKLLRPQVWGTTLIHMVAMQALFMAVLYLANFLLPDLGLNLGANVLIAFALTFSSTVFVIQLLQARGEMASRHAGLAVGILIVQDIAAIIFLGFSTGKVPEPSAILLLALIPARGLIIKALGRAGHGELFTLSGLALAIGGAQLFELFGFKGDLGALIIGVLLAGDRKAKELSRNLLQFKDLFLVGFFLSIGLAGWPGSNVLIVSLSIGALCLVKPLLYYPLMTWLHTPARTALLASLSLANFSEFGLIVIAVAAGAGWVDPQWTAGLSLAIAMSFLLSSQINRYAHAIYHRWGSHLQNLETARVRAAVPDTSDARLIVLGMGRIGTGAYDSLAQLHGPTVLGVDENDAKLRAHREQLRRVVSADASDPGFWRRIDLDQLELVMLALTNHPENVLVGNLLRELGYAGHIAAVVRFPEEAEELEAMGISAFNLYAQAGSGFAAHAEESLGTRANAAPTPT